MDLAFEQQRIDDHPVVVDRRVAHQCERPGLRIDLHLAHVASAGVVVLPGPIVAGGLQADFVRTGKVLGLERRRHDLSQRRASVGAGDRERAAGEDDVLGARFHQLRRDAPAALDDRLGRERHPHARDGRGTRAARPASGTHHVAVPLQDLHGVEGHPEPVGGDLRERRLVAVAARLPGEGHRELSGGLEYQGDAVVEIAVRLLEQREAEAPEHASGSGFRAPRLEPCPIRERERIVHVGRELAAVELDPGAGRVRHRLGRHHVQATQLGGVPAGLARRRIDEALDHVVVLGLARPAEGVDRDRVGERHPGSRVPCGDPVDAGDAAGAADGGDGGRRRGRVRAHVRHGTGADREEPPLGVERELRLGHVIAALAVAEEAFGALRDPLHGPPQPPCRPGDEHVLRVRRHLDPERPADVVGDDANPRFRDSQRPGERCEQVADALRRRPDRVPAVSGLVLGNDSAGLHRGDDQPIVDDVEPGDVGGARECGAGRVRVPSFPVQSDVAGGGRPQLRRTRLKRGAAVDHHVQLFVVHDDPIGGIRRGAAVLRDDHRHGVADVHHPVAGEQRVGDVDGLLAVPADHAVRLAERRDAVRRQIVVRECRDHSGCRRRVRGVDGDDARVRVR